MRKGRLELWLGFGCALATLATAGVSLNRDRIIDCVQRLPLARQFQGSPKELCKPLLAGMLDTGRVPRAIWASPHELEILGRSGADVLIRNDRAGRVYVHDPWATPYAIDDDGCYSYHEIRSLDGPMPSMGDGNWWLPGRVLDPGETAKLRIRGIRRLRALRYPDRIADIPPGRDIPPCPPGQELSQGL